MTDIDQQITIRHLGKEDRQALARLAGLDSARAPRGDAIAAFAPGGAMVAALSLETGELVADPFVASADAASLLRVRAGQLTGEGDHRRHAGLLSRLHLRIATP